MPDLPIKTPEQLVMLASIVEKETGKPEERTRVAAVFVNRLKQKMRLQSDPTIIYGLVGGKGTLGRPIMKSEIEQPTPYNTYLIDGLPPGPIANPGLASLEAAANPARTQGNLFRGRRHGRARFCGNVRAASEERRAAAGDGNRRSEGPGSGRCTAGGLAAGRGCRCARACPATRSAGVITRTRRTRTHRRRTDAPAL